MEHYWLKHQMVNLWIMESSCMTISYLLEILTDTTNWFINHSLLPSKKFPIIFQSVQGYFARSDANKRYIHIKVLYLYIRIAFKQKCLVFSLFNMNEVTTVMYYIEKLLQTKLKNGRNISQEDIGVVTPYKMQRRCIAQACHRQNFEDITIGTAEVFQGQERPIMIVSTVRSGGNKLGFVNNPRVSTYIRQKY